MCIFIINSNSNSLCAQGFVYRALGNANRNRNVCIRGMDMGVCRSTIILIVWVHKGMCVCAFNARVPLCRYKQYNSVREHTTALSASHSFLLPYITHQCISSTNISLDFVAFFHPSLLWLSSRLIC